MIPQGQGIKTYGIVCRWCTDVSGLGLAEQAKILMHPEPPKREEELAENAEMWQDKMRRLEAHEDEYKLVPVFKINAPRMLMTGRTRNTLIYGKEIETRLMRRSPTRVAEQGQGLRQKEKVGQHGPEVHAARE